jgi:predicted CopG family antitoxin
MGKSILIQDDTHAKLYRLINEKRNHLLKNKDYSNVSFDDIISDLIKNREEQLQ